MLTPTVAAPQVGRPEGFELLTSYTKSHFAVYRPGPESCEREHNGDLSAVEIDNWIALSEGFSIAHLKELVLAVRCLGVALNDAAKRIKAGLKPRQSSENFTRSRMGFGRTGR